MNARLVIDIGFIEQRFWQRDRIPRPEMHDCPEVVACDQRLGHLFDEVTSDWFLVILPEDAEIGIDGNIRYRTDDSELRVIELPDFLASRGGVLALKHPD